MFLLERPGFPIARLPPLGARPSPLCPVFPAQGHFHPTIRTLRLRRPRKGWEYPLSITIMTAVWAIDLPHTDKLVLLALADNANDDGVCWPSITLLAKKCSTSARTIQRAIGKLVDAGHVSVAERYQQSHYYTIHPRQVVTGCQPVTPVRLSPVPRQPVTPLVTTSPHTGDRVSPIIIIESSSEPSVNLGEVRASRSTRATRLPDEFGLTPERRAVAETEKADPDREFAQFTDHFRAAPGVKGRKNDWDATWRNWCRRAPDFKPRGTAKAAYVPPKSIEQLEAEERSRAQR